MKLIVEPEEGIVLSKDKPLDPWKVTVCGQSLTVRGNRLKAIEAGRELLDLLTVPDEPLAAE